MNTYFEFLWDSGATGVEENVNYKWFCDCALKEAIDHYNTDNCYIDEKGHIHPHQYEMEDGTIITEEHFIPDLYLFDKKLQRLIKLNINGYDDNKEFEVFIYKTELKTIAVEGNLFDYNSKQHLSQKMLNWLNTVTN